MGDVDEECAPQEASETGVTSGPDSTRWAPSLLEPLGVLAFEKAAGMLKDEHEAMDIAQAVLAALVARSGPPPPNPEAWVTNRAKWLALNELRRRKHEEEKFGRLARGTVPPSEDFTDRLVARSLLNETLAALSPRQRKALELQFLLDDPPATVAKAMGITKETLKKTRQRALTRARSEYERLAAERSDQ